MPGPDGCIFREELELLNIFEEKIACTESLIDQLAATEEAITWLSSLPGIGKFHSVVIRWEVDNIDWFQEAKKFASYPGLVSSTYASASQTVHRCLTKRGNQWLRWAFIEAVTPAVRKSPRLRTDCERIKARRGAKDARTSIARKLAELTWTIWTGTPLL